MQAIREAGGITIAQSTATAKYDGMPLAAPIPIPNRFALAPAQRMDLMVDIDADPGGEAVLVSIERDIGYVQAGFPVSGVACMSKRAAPDPLPPNSEEHSRAGRTAL